jgi:hypothetical protein
MRSFVNKAEACSGRYPIETLRIVARSADKEDEAAA